jgi:hypothetical protein
MSNLLGWDKRRERFLPAVDNHAPIAATKARARIGRARVTECK